MASTEYPSRGPDSGRPGLWLELPASLPAAVAYVTGPDLVFEFTSDGYRKAIRGHDVIGRPFREALPEVVGRPRFAALRQALRTGEPRLAREEGLWVRRDGAEPEYIYLDSVYQPVHDEAGRVAGVLIFATDVSDHVRDRQQLEDLASRLQRSEERYRTLFETLPHGIIHLDRDGSVIGVNPAAVEIMGHVPDQLSVGERAARIWHEDGTPYSPEELPMMVALRTGKVVSGVAAAIHNSRTGEIRWVRFTAVPDAWDAQGRPRRAYTVFTDITEQYTAQARLRESNRLLGRLREANVLGVYVGNEEGIECANDAFLDIVGYTRADLAAGHLTWKAIIPPELARFLDDAVEELRRTGAYQPYDKEFLHRDAHRVPVAMGAAVLDRDPLRWTTFVVDLTARQRAEQERAELLASEHSARMSADAAQDQLALLLDASNLVAATGNQEKLRDQLAQLMVPTLADCCALLLLTDQGMLRAATVAHRDPARAAAFQDLLATDIPPDDPALHAALTQASTQLITDVSAMTPAGPARRRRPPASCSASAPRARSSCPC